MEFVVSWGRKLLEGMAAVYQQVIYVLNSRFQIGNVYFTFWELMAYVIGFVIVAFIVARIARMLIGD